MTEKLQTLRDNAAVRWLALLLLALAMFCSYIFMDILSPSRISCNPRVVGIPPRLARCRVRRRS